MKTNAVRTCALLLLLPFVASAPVLSQQLFFDDFEGGADPAWGNEAGSWSAHDGVYDAAFPSNNPGTYSSVTTLTGMTDFILELDVDSVDDGGVWLRSEYNGGAFNGVLLVTGGNLGSYDGLYWHVIENGAVGPMQGQAIVPGLQNSDVHLKIVVRGNNYYAYLNSNAAPVTTLTTDAFTTGSIALYDNSVYGPEKQTFDNVEVLEIISSGGGIFFDDFEDGEDPAWGNQRGEWSAHDGVYDALYPENDPVTYTDVTTFDDLTDFAVEVDVNNVDDGGIWLRSDYSGGDVSGVLLVTGGARNIGGTSGTFDGLYWHVVENNLGGPPSGRVVIPGLQNMEVRLRIDVIDMD